jgi:hypothetical protein
VRGFFIWCRLFLTLAKLAEEPPAGASALTVRVPLAELYELRIQAVKLMRRLGELERELDGIYCRLAEWTDGPTRAA